MNDQKRVMLTIGVCLAIFVAWQLLMPTPPKRDGKKSPGPLTTATEPGTAPSMVPGRALETGEGTLTVPEATGESSPSVVAEGTGGTSSALPHIEAPKEASRSFETKLFTGEISNREAKLIRLTLKEYNERQTSGKEAAPVPVSLVLAERDGHPYQARIKWQLGPLGVASQPPLRFRDTDEGTFSLTGKTAEGLEAEIRVSPRPDTYAIDYALSIANPSDNPQQVGATIELAMYQQKGEEGGFLSGPGAVFSGICQAGGVVERRNLSDLEEEPFVPHAPAAWAALDRQYFVVAAVAANPNTTRCDVSGKDRVITVNYALGQETIPAKGSWQRSFTLFAGPKKDAALEAVSPGLLAMIDYTIMGIPLGFIARPMVYLLNLFHGWLNSWGLAIMLLTLVVKVVLFPFTYKSAVSMRKVQMLKPQLDKIKEMYPDDREKQQTEQWKLYKEGGANPLGGCLPMLLQMPVWFALYRALWTSVDLYHQSFLWLQDLTAKEPGIPFLAVSLGAVFFVQQRLTPMATDNQQAKLFKWVMPVMFTVFMFALPSGLVLYIFVNSVLSIIQQLAINKTVGPPPAAAVQTATVATLDRGRKTSKPATPAQPRSPRRARRAK